MKKVQQKESHEASEHKWKLDHKGNFLEAEHQTIGNKQQQETIPKN